MAELRAVGPARRGRTLAVALELLDVAGALAWLEGAVERFDVAVLAPGTVDGEEVFWRARWRARGLSERALGRIRFVTGKVPAEVYLDRRAVRFEGEFPDVGALRAMMQSGQ